MNAIVEKRNSLRVDVGCKLHYKMDGDSQLHEFTCVNISCSGKSFISDHNFQVGEEVEVYVIPENQVAPTAQFFIKIVRSESWENGQFLIGAIIVFDDENQDD